MRNLGTKELSKRNIYEDLANAVVDRYQNRTDKRARYRRKNPDIKPLGDPNIRPLTDIERKTIKNLHTENAS